MTRLHRCCTAIAASGVFGDGFQTVALPHTAAMSAFQAHTATGKLKAVIDADDAQRVPLLVHPVRRPLGVHGLAVEHARLTDGEVGDVDHLLHFAVAFGLDLAVLERDEAAQGVLVLAQEQRQDGVPPRRAWARGPRARRAAATAGARARQS